MKSSGRTNKSATLPAKKESDIKALKQQMIELQAAFEFSLSQDLVTKDDTEIEKNVNFQVTPSN